MKAKDDSGLINLQPYMRIQDERRHPDYARRKDWSKLLQPLLLPLAFVIGIGSFVLVADGKPKKPTKKRPGRAAAERA